MTQQSTMKQQPIRTQQPQHKRTTLKTKSAQHMNNNTKLFNKIKSLLFNKYYYLTNISKFTLFYCIPNIFIANGIVALGCYSCLLYTKYVYCIWFCSCRVLLLFIYTKYFY